MRNIKHDQNNASLINQFGTRLPSSQIEVCNPSLGAVPSASIITRKRHFSSEDLIALALDDAIIRVKDFYPPKLCMQIVDRLGGSPLLGAYVNAPNIGRAGQAFFESQADEECRHRYEEHSVDWMRELRSLCSPLLSPIDQFRIELDEAWQPGARLMSLNSRKMFAGLPRRFRCGSEAEPHQDVLAWDAPNSPEAAGLSGQWAANIYLTAAEKGGALELWNFRLNRSDYERQRTPNSYGVRRETLSDPIAALHPEVGELILFDAGRMHAVSKIDAGDRWSWSCFVAYRSVVEPLRVWS